MHMNTAALYQVEQIRRFEAAAIRMGTTGQVLMERAGQAAWNILRQYWPHAHHITICCGTGNNGGDGFVLARLAKEAGVSVQVLLVGHETKIKNEAKTALLALKAANQIISPFTPDLILEDTELIVDALLGTGFKEPLALEYEAAIDAIHHARKPILAMDIPSGLHPDTGVFQTKAIHATVTITFVGLKQGFFTADGLDCVGQLEWHDLNLSVSLEQSETPSAWRLSPKTLGHFLPPRARNVHKKQFGHVLVVGGNKGFSGAVLLSGRAALSVGAGLVTIATHPLHAASLNVCYPELMCHGIANHRSLERFMEQASVIVIGPGLGLDAWAKMLWNSVKASPLPCIVDADALKLLAQEPEIQNRWVLTPHPGEAAILLGTTTRTIQQDRFRAASAIKTRFGGCTVLKGAGTLVVGSKGHLTVCEYGNPGMATAGMGDVLTGVIAGLLAQGLSLGQAARWGVYIHAKAGDVAAKTGTRGILASDVLPYIIQIPSQNATVPRE